MKKAFTNSELKDATKICMEQDLNQMGAEDACSHEFSTGFRDRMTALGKMAAAVRKRSLIILIAAVLFLIGVGLQFVSAYKTKKVSEYKPAEADFEELIQMVSDLSKQFKKMRVEYTIDGVKYSCIVEEPYSLGEEVKPGITVYYTENDPSEAVSRAQLDQLTKRASIPGWIGGLLIGMAVILVIQSIFGKKTTGNRPDPGGQRPNPIYAGFPEIYRIDPEDQPEYREGDLRMNGRIVDIIRAVFPGVLIIFGILLYSAGLTQDRKAEQYERTTGLISDIYEAQMSDGTIRKRGVVRYDADGKVYEWEMDEFIEQRHKVGEVEVLYYNKNDPADAINASSFRVLSQRGSWMEAIGWVAAAAGLITYAARAVQWMRRRRQ